jgi:hypothetical protein
VNLFIFFVYLSIYAIYLFNFFFHLIDTINILKLAKITSIDPPSNTIIPLETSTLKIVYEVPVLLSSRNITIYQFDEQNVRTRQMTSGEISEFYSVDEDKRVITVNVLSSTFNVQNATYHVYVGANFVKHNETDEPINKLPHTSWILKTGIYSLFILLYYF